MTQPSQDTLRQELHQLRARISELEKAKRDLEKRISQTSEAIEVAPMVTSQAELESTLGGFVKRVGFIIQAEKCVIMLYDRETGELVAQWPALGLSRDQARTFRLRATQGISGEIFREGRAMICHDTVADARTVKEFVALLRIRNMLGVPLVVEHRDTQQQVLERSVIGVINVFNKRGGGNFNEEDVKLLTVLARNAAALISNAQYMIRIAAEKQQLETALQSMLAGVLVMATDERVLLLNSAARHILQLPAENGVGRPAAEVVGPGEVLDLLRDSMASKEEVSREISVGGEGGRTFQMQTALLRDDRSEPTGIVATFSDITEIRNIERMKTEFVSSVSHELRTPLTSIKGFVRTLLDDTEGYYDRDTQREFYQIIDAECDRLVRLISDMLNVARIESGRALELDLSTVDLAALVAKVITSQKSYTTRHKFYTDIPESCRHIVADEDKIDQILTNLVSNAVKYSPQGGQVSVTASDKDGSVAVTVSDQGIGIPAEHLGKMFSRFHRVDSADTRKVGGTGIGLYLVRHLVEAHGGTVSVESQVGQGSSFTFVMPKRPTQATAERK